MSDCQFYEHRVRHQERADLNAERGRGEPIEIPRDWCTHKNSPKPEHRSHSVGPLLTCEGCRDKCPLPAEKYADF